MAIKHFKVNDKEYSFEYISQSTDGNHASNYSFVDEEIVREQLFYPYIKKDDIVFDIGSSFGSYALAALSMGATVYAWCPEHEFPTLKEAARKNRYRKAHVFDFGFHSKNGYFKTDTAEFFKTVSSQTIYDTSKAGPAGWYIPVRTLDDWMFNVGMPKYNICTIDFIKIDTEGAEAEIIKGGDETIKEYGPRLMIENHLFKNLNVKNEIDELLKFYEYKEVRTIPSGMANHISHTLYET